MSIKSKINGVKRVLNATLFGREIIDFEKTEKQGSKPEIEKEIVSRVKRFDFSMTGMLPQPDLKSIPVSKLRALFKDPHVRACISSRKAATKKLHIRIKDKPEDPKQTEFMKESIKRLDLSEIVDDVLDTPLFGRQTFEVVWDKDFLPTQVVGKPKELFDYDKDGKLCYHPNSYDFIDLPEKNFITLYHGHKWGVNNGDAILESVFWPVFFKKTGAKFWAQFMEKYAVPWLIAKYRRGASDDEIDELYNAAENMIQAAVAAIPDDGSMEIVEASGKAASADVFEKNMRFHNAEISKALLGATMTIEQGENGARAVSETHMDIRQDIVDADSILVLNLFQQIVNWIDELHFGQTADHPEVELYDPAEEKKEKADEAKAKSETAERDLKLKQHGVKLSEQYFTRVYGFQEGDFILESSKANEISPAEFASKNDNSDNPDGLEDLTESIKDKKLQDQMEQIMDPIITLIEDSADYEQVMEKLFDLFPDLNSTDMEQKMATALTIAELKGGSEV